MATNDSLEYQLDGYLGCFEDVYGESLVELEAGFINRSNKGDVCKAACKNKTKRYAGTKGLWCYCGSGFVQNKTRNSTECNVACPGNSSEICGGIYEVTYHTRISLYDTWVCITDPCQNEATCTDIDAENYNCSCSAGWTGRVCNEKVTATTYSISSSSSRHDIGITTVVAKPSKNKLAIYIPIPVSIVVLIVSVLIVTVFILRKRLSRNKDSRKAFNQTSGNTGHSLIAVATNVYNDNDTIPLETSVNVHATDDAETGHSEHNYYTLEQTGNVSRSYNADQRRGSTSQNDDSGYGRLQARSTALGDPTYSHTTTTGSQDNTDYMYSHLNQSVGNRDGNGYPNRYSDNRIRYPDTIRIFVHFYRL